MRRFFNNQKPEEKKEPLPLPVVPKTMEENVYHNEVETEEKKINTSLIEISPEYFGELWKYIDDDDITVVDYNGYGLWVQDFNNRKTKIEDVDIPPLFIEQFSQRIANSVSKELNKQNPVVEAETEKLRVSIWHESVAVTGRSISIRKTLPMTRIETKEAVESGYVSPEVLCFLINCIKAHMNLIICGGVGVGKTECAKYISQYIPDEERVITIEDNLEWRYHQINPNADCVELQVSDIFSYEDAIVASLRHDPKWLMVSEVRGEEVTAYIKQLTTGVNGITTLHTDDARKVPNRLVNMASDKIGKDRMESDIFSFLDVAVLLNLRKEDDIEKRFIDQVCIFSNDMGNNESRLLVNNGLLVTNRLPDEIQFKFKKAGITDPFNNETIMQEISKDKSQNTFSNERQKDAENGSDTDEPETIKEMSESSVNPENEDKKDVKNPVPEKETENRIPEQPQETIQIRSPRIRKERRG